MGNRNVPHIVIVIDFMLDSSHSVTGSDDFSGHFVVSSISCLVFVCRGIANQFKETYQDIESPLFYSKANQLVQNIRRTMYSKYV